MARRTSSLHADRPPEAGNATKGCPVGMQSLQRPMLCWCIVFAVVALKTEPRVGEAHVDVVAVARVPVPVRRGFKG